MGIETHSLRRRKDHEDHVQTSHDGLVVFGSLSATMQSNKSQGKMKTVQLLFLALMLVLPIGCASSGGGSGGGPQTTSIRLLPTSCYLPTAQQSVEIRVFTVVSSGGTGSIKQFGNTYISSGLGGLHTVNVPNNEQFSFTVRIEVAPGGSSCCNPTQSTILNYEAPLGSFQAEFPAAPVFSHCK